MLHHHQDAAAAAVADDLVHLGVSEGVAHAPNLPEAAPAGSITGSDADDSLAGTQSSDTIVGGYGNDRENGMAGDDTVYGGGSGNPEFNDGNDTLFGGTGDDVLVGGSGDNRIDGGAGLDIVWFKASTGTMQGIHADYSGYDAAKGGTVDNLEGGVDQLFHVESIDVKGTNKADKIIGSSGHNNIDGVAGSDRLEGGAGDDTLQESSSTASPTLLGGAGDDRLILSTPETSGHAVVNGGSGRDLLQLLDENSGELGRGAVTAWDGKSVTITASDGSYVVTAHHVEDITVFAYGAKSSLTGGAGNDNFTSNGHLDGAAGDDNLNGSGTLIGGEGADTVFGGSGADSLDGGGGYDLYGVDMQLNSNQHTIDASGFDITGAAHTVDYGVGSDSIVGFEAVSIRDDASNDTIIGSAGNDQITNGYGADSISGGAGDDLIVQTGTVPPFGSATDGNDTLDGGAGIDTLSFAQSDPYQGAFGYTVDLGKGSVTSAYTGTDVISGFEHVIGWEGADTMIGSASGDWLQGASGADSLSGGLGSDTLDGGDGNDVISGGKGHDIINGGAGDDVLAGNGGKNVFQFDKDAVSRPGEGARIQDLTNRDVINLGRIDADTGTHGNQAFTIVDHLDGHAGELAISYDDVRDLTIVQGDVNGDGVADLLIRIDGHHTDFSNFVL